VSESNKRNAQKNREKALTRYYTNPSVCEFCHSIIEVRNNEKPADARRRKFCNHTCAAKYTNVRRGRKLKYDVCQKCGAKLPKIKSSSGKGYLKRRYCELCLPIVQRQNVQKRHPNRLPDLIETMTLREVRKIKGRAATRTSITKHAKLVYEASNKPKHCILCNFLPVYQLCHKTPVASFPKDTLISEVNNLDNLVALCPNHHILFDTELLTEDEKNKILHG